MAILSPIDGPPPPPPPPPWFDLPDLGRSSSRLFARGQEQRTSSRRAPGARVGSKMRLRTASHHNSQRGGIWLQTGVKIRNNQARKPGLGKFNSSAPARPAFLHQFQPEPPAGFRTPGNDPIKTPKRRRNGTAPRSEGSGSYHRLRRGLRRAETRAHPTTIREVPGPDVFRLRAHVMTVSAAGGEVRVTDSAISTSIRAGSFPDRVVLLVCRPRHCVPRERIIAAAEMRMTAMLARAAACRR